MAGVKPGQQLVTTVDQLRRTLAERQPRQQFVSHPPGVPVGAHPVPMPLPQQVPDTGAVFTPRPPVAPSGSGVLVSDACCQDTLAKLEEIRRLIADSVDRDKQNLYASMLMQAKPPITSSGPRFALTPLAATTAYYPCFKNTRGRPISVRVFSSFVTAGGQVNLSKTPNIEGQVGLVSDASLGYLETDGIILLPDHELYAGSNDTNITLTSSDVLRFGICDPGEVFDYLR